MPPVLLAVDGNSLVHRAFHSRAGAGLSSDPVWAVRGLLTQLVAAVERVGADAVMVGFDDPADSIRRRTWPHYKATRADKPGVLVSQLLAAAAVLEELGVCVVTPPGLEADDVLCSAARHGRELGAQTVLMTSDRDAFALMDGSTRVLRILNGGVEASPLLTCDRLELMIGIRPHQYRDYAALRGDPSDNLPGVDGVGPKTAARLLQAFGDAASLFADLEAGGARTADLVGTAMLAKLSHQDAHGRWQHNCQVMQMHSDVPLTISFEAGPGQSGPGQSGPGQSGPGQPGAGRLPLSVPPIRAVFTEHRLVASLPMALRVLAHHDAPVPQHPAQSAGETADPRSPAGSAWRRGSGNRKFGPLAKKAEDSQLALF